MSTQDHFAHRATCLGSGWSPRLEASARHADGVEVKDPSRQPELERAAYRMAALVVISYLVGRPIERASIAGEDRIQSSGIDLTLDERLLSKAPTPRPTAGVLRRRYEPWFMQVFASPIAEAKLVERPTSWETDSPLEGLPMTRGLASSSADALAHARWLWLRTKALLDAPFYWAAVRVIADYLLKNGSIDGQKARAMIKAA